VQYHPEYKSRVEAPHPLFAAFIDACRKQGSAAAIASPGDKLLRSERPANPG
jgi:hypothetical protein